MILDPRAAKMSEHMQSIYKLTRQIKRDDVGMYNCLCSIVDDAEFVNEVTNLYPGIPVFANLRCGLWYAPHAQDTCYFKVHILSLPLPHGPVFLMIHT